MTTEEIAVRPVALNQIVLDDQIQTRPLDEYTVGLYAEAMEQGADMFPPLCVVGRRQVLAVGWFHRMAALLRVGKSLFVRYKGQTRRVFTFARCQLPTR